MYCGPRLELHTMALHSSVMLGVRLTWVYGAVSYLYNPQRRAVRSLQSTLFQNRGGLPRECQKRRTNGNSYVWYWIFSNQHQSRLLYKSLCPCVCVSVCLPPPSLNNADAANYKTSLLRRLQVQTLPDATPPIGQIHPFSKMAVPFEPLMGFWCPSGFRKWLITFYFITGRAISNSFSVAAP